MSDNDKEPIHDPEVIARVQRMFELCAEEEERTLRDLRSSFPQESETLIKRRLNAWWLKDPNYNRASFHVDAFPPPTSD
jgi:hypothetical protein